MKQITTYLKSLTKSNWHMILIAFYFSAFAVMNIIATKQISIAGFVITSAGTFVFSWITFLCMDVFTEVWGKKSAIKTFVGAAVISLLFSIFYQICAANPGATWEPEMNNAFKLIFSSTTRILLASISAFLIGSYVNTIIMDRMKTRARDENNKSLFVLRAIVSTVFGQLIDNALFFILAFAPIGGALGINLGFEMDMSTILQIIAMTSLVEIVFESAVSPLTAKFAVYLKGIKNT